MITTKKKVMEYIQKEMIKEFKHFTTEKSNKCKEDSDTGNEEQKEDMKNKQQTTERIPYLSVITLNVNRSVITL